MTDWKDKYKHWPRTESDEEIRSDKEAAHERWLGKEISKVAIAKYNETWGDHHGQEITTRQSFRRFANELSYSKVEIYS